MNQLVRPASNAVRLPKSDRSIELYRLGVPRAFPQRVEGAFNRIAIAAAHVVADPLGPGDPWLDAAIDWEGPSPIAIISGTSGSASPRRWTPPSVGWGSTGRRRSSSSAQPLRREEAQGRAGVLRRRNGPSSLGRREEPRRRDPRLRGSDRGDRGPGRAHHPDGVTRARANAKGADDYATVYGRILGQVREPVIIHWLGDMFDPALAGYWGSADLDAATDAAVAIINTHAGKVDGVKISLLDKEREVAMRRRLAKGVRMYTGDDFDFAEVIEGDGQFHSDALLGIFDAIAPAASAALTRLAAGDGTTFNEVLAPTVALSRHIFQAPTRFYKTGIVFMAYLNGHQDHFTMVGGQESARSTLHLAELFRLADRAGLLHDPERSASRMRGFLATRGVEP